MVGTALYILGFPFPICEMTLGLLISNFYQAFMISMIAKVKKFFIEDHWGMYNIFGSLKYI